MATASPWRPIKMALIVPVFVRLPAVAFSPILIAMAVTSRAGIGFVISAKTASVFSEDWAIINLRYTRAAYGVFKISRCHETRSC